MYKKMFVIILISLIFSSAAPLLFSQTIDLQFVVVTNDGTNFDVKVQCKRSSTGWDNMGDANFAFSFNTSGLDNPILLTPHGFNSAPYNAMTVTDVGTWTSVNIDYTGSDGGGTAIPTATWTDVATVRFDVLDAGQTSNLVWKTDASFSCYDDDGSTSVSQGTCTGLDVSLPVSISTMAATGSAEGHVTVTWETASEASAMGYKVWRSSDENGSYTCLVNEPIKSEGLASNGYLYTFNDRTAEKGKIYWYKIEEITVDGQSVFFGPVMLVSPPSDFALTQNYPNPFNPETTINYQIAEESEVTIKVYSLLGREIKTLISKKLPAASYYAKWDGTDNFGQKVSSGIYLIQMKAGTFSQMRKMTLMR